MNPAARSSNSPHTLDEAQTNEFRSYLDRLAGSPGFLVSRRGKDLLLYLVSCWLTEKEVTEFAIGLDVLGKPSSFDTRIDSSVRAEMSRLRKALAAYYQDAGSRDPWRIEFPTRGYVPQVTAKPPSAVEAEATPLAIVDTPAARTSARRRFWPWVVASGVAIGILVAWLLSQKIGHSTVSVSSAASTAQELYQKGHAYVARHEFMEMERAATYLNGAIAKDPGFAPAYSDLARTYLFRVLYGEAADRVTAQATAAAMTAVSLDPTSADAHTTSGAVRAVFAWDWAGARQEFRRALELDPNVVQAHDWYAVLDLLPHGDFAGAHAELDRARQLDPSAAYPVDGEAFVYMFERQYPQAIELSRQALELDPASAPALSHLLATFWLQGNYSAWIAAHERSSEDWSRSRVDLWRRDYSEGGAAGLLRAQLNNQLKAEADQRAHSSGAAAVYALTAGRPDIALKELEDCFPHHEFSLMYLKIDPNFDGLRSDARFQELVRRVGLSAP